MNTLGSPTIPLPQGVDIAIIGGGIMGLCTAYHLAKLSKLSIVVIERSYLASGASGRNGGGVRMQWGDKDHVQVMQESIAICRRLTQELKINLWFRQSGYLFLARTEAAEKLLLRNADLHQELGAPTQLLSPSQAKALVPQLNSSDLRCASFNPLDGVVFPWPFLWGYAAQATKRGVSIRTHTAVTHLEQKSACYELYLSSGERLQATRVINATGAWSPTLNKLVGVDLPNFPRRHEILSSEPLKSFLDPLVVDLASGLYISQSTRGELVTGISPEHGADQDDSQLNPLSSLHFLAHLSRKLIHILPVAAHIKVLRQWAGTYDVSPDGHAIVGPSPGHPNLIQLCGFTGHGFMMAPAVGHFVAMALIHDIHHPILEKWSPSRFQTSAAKPSEDMIIG